MNDSRARALGTMGRLAGALVAAAGLLAGAASYGAPVQAASCFKLEVTSLTGPAQLGPDGTGTYIVTVDNPNPAGTCDDAMNVKITFTDTPHAVTSIDGGPGVGCSEEPPNAFAGAERCLARSFGGGARATITFSVKIMGKKDHIAVSAHALHEVKQEDGYRPDKVGDRDLVVSVPAPGGAPAPNAPAPGGGPAAKPQGSSAAPTVQKGAPDERVVTTIQYLLSNQGWELDPDGDFGPLTEAALRDFQERKSLTTDPKGVVGQQTWAALLVTVEQGSSDGDAVSAVQSQLKSRGMDVDVDGVFGPQTDAAVRDFQQRKSLHDDGIVGPLTWAALLAAD